MTNTQWPLSQPPLYAFSNVTREELEYAELAIIDISKASTETGRAELASQVYQAMNQQGFFYVVNHGYTSEQTSRIFSIAKMAFDDVDKSEKELYVGKSTEVYQGYKPKQTWLINNNIRDQIEHYNSLLTFALDFDVRLTLAMLLTRGLELPEHTLVRQHQFDAEGESAVRFMKYFPRTEEEEAKTRHVWLKGHHDIGCLTVLWSQLVGGLQILSPNGKWRWVKHIDNALLIKEHQVINAGDGLDFLCGGYYPPTRHRVIRPPADQAKCTRLGVFYFYFADDDVQLVPHAESPVLQRVGIKQFLKPGDVAPTMKEWRKNRVRSYGHTKLTEGAEKGTEEEIVCGVVVKHYT
ncbi:uncharacterized protein EV420DRAFT_1671526 [Desarmillaria tabescens]|uniref:Clavaminate synthase-like protein n=1 Tax=Armillaria tabescens TaxID=1929756 RepID=A0AA39N7Y6_ARMTA|nr:uncharacterized protein EV420DRAFT_1671526 [Desarmillaria tabescens]KAK0460684.1 hypothetical protein EV420DRAFT_1671526 [Desarmillaria tabescens]